MAQVLKVLGEDWPACVFAGRRYCEQERNPQTGTFAHKWQQWFENGWFDLLQGEETFGLIQRDAYWIGKIVGQKTKVSPAFDTLSLRESRVAVCLVQAKEPALYMAMDACDKALKEQGYKVKDGPVLFLERYHPERFNNIQKNGERILDVCFFVE